MLAFAWLWHDPSCHAGNGIAKRLATSLCAGIGGHYAAVELDGMHFAFRPLRSTPAQSRAWRPALLPSGRIVAFHGYFDNAETLASELGCRKGELARLYGLAVERWGDEADRRIIGEYCAIVADPSSIQIRLSRSPLRAPPLYYFHDERMAAAASVPRALFAIGVPQRINEAHLADVGLMNHTDHEASFFEQVASVPAGSVVELQRSRPRRLRKYYDLLALPEVRLASDADYVQRASELLDEGVRACMAGFRRPGATLSGGLDSPQVAVRALAALPSEQRLPTFTFHPEEGYDGRVEPGSIGDERPFVKAFAAMHPRLEPHFTDNGGYEQDYRWNDLFHLTGCASPSLAHMYLFHGLCAGAARQGCDLLLLAGWGNTTLSNEGRWGFVEYLLKGRWRQLRLALAHHSGRDRPMPWRFLAQCILPLLPNWAWRQVWRVALPRQRFLGEAIQPFTREYRISSGAENRLRSADYVQERYQPRSRRHALKLIFQTANPLDDIYQGFEQMYGVALRDPMAYRPLAEFCFGLPTEMFMRDGITRWLAKQLAKGIMPEEQRANRLYGRWDADWQLRIGRRRPQLLAELDRLEQDERMRAMLDIKRLKSLLEDWPEETVVDPQEAYPREFGVPRALVTSRFIDYVEGRNSQ